MRSAANLCYLYTGEQKTKGRRRVYESKKVIGEVDRLEFAGEMDDTDVYTTVVNCMNLKRNVCIAYLVNKTKAVVSFTLLLSTDTELDTLSISAITKRDIKSSFYFWTRNSLQV